MQTVHTGRTLPGLKAKLKPRTMSEAEHRAQRLVTDTYNMVDALRLQLLGQIYPILPPDGAGKKDG